MIRPLFFILLVGLALVAPLPAWAIEPPKILARVVAINANVRSAPNVTDSQILGVLPHGALIYVSGLDESGNFAYFTYWDKPAWIGISTINLDKKALAKLKAEAPRFAQITASGYEIQPLNIQPGQAFRLLLKLTNASATDAPVFEIATAFEDGVFWSENITGLLGGQTGVVYIDCPGVNATGYHTLEFAIDLNHDAGKGSIQRIKYFVDFPRPFKDTIRLPANSNSNLAGDIDDLSWDGKTLVGINGASLMLMGDEYKTATIHYDLLRGFQAPFVDAIEPGQMIRIQTAEGMVGVIFVDKLDAGDLVFHFYLYGDN